MAYTTVNPFTDKEVKSFEEISKVELDQKLKKAAACFDTWCNTSFNERKKIIQKVAYLMRERSDELATLITLEKGETNKRK